MSNENNFNVEIADIIAGRHSYHSSGSGEGTFRMVAPGVIFYGSPGVSSSIGQWIRATRRMFKAGTPIHNLTAYWGADRDDGTHRRWYFQIELGYELHIVGGCTDFSGEGEHARKLALAYMGWYSTIPIQERPVTRLVDFLIEGWLPFIQKQRELVNRS